jgi:hypothetical protein
MATASEAKEASRWVAVPSPRPSARPSPKRTRRLKPWLSLSLAVMMLFSMLVATALVGELTARAGFQVDALQAQLTTAQRHRQALEDQVVSLTTASRLAADAKQLGVPLSAVVLAGPQSTAGHPQTGAQASRGIWATLRARVSGWLSAIRGLERGGSSGRGSVHRGGTYRRAR